jgi:hypothetical protein
VIWIKENIQVTPSFARFNEHVVMIEGCVQSNPSLCVETCKTLIEGICKTILTDKNVTFSGDISFQGLVHKTITSILHNEDHFGEDLGELGRRVASVSQKLAELRNVSGFASHGMDVLNPRLTDTISVLALKITDVIGGFILRCYFNDRRDIRDRRIHYEDCEAFNLEFDEVHPLAVETISLSASLALYNEDYEVYREAYFEFIENLNSQSE